MNIFRRPDYQSEVTQFISQLKDQKPALDAQQQAGRALLWDKDVDREVWSNTGPHAWRKSLMCILRTSASRAPFESNRKKWL